MRRYGQARGELLARIVQDLEADDRALAVWLAGSFGRGVEDAWSDLDLHIAVMDDAFATFWADRHQRYARVGHPILIQPEMPANGMPGGNFQLVIFSGPIEVDWSAGPASMAARPPATRLLFDRVGIPVETPPALAAVERRGQANRWLTFFWAMAPIAVKYAGRGESRQAASQIDLLTESTIALWRLIEQPDGPNPWEPVTNRPIDPELDAVLPRLGWTIDPQAALEVIAALCELVERWHPALTALGVDVPAGMPGEVEALMTMAEAEIQGGDPGNRRPYR